MTSAAAVTAGGGEVRRSLRAASAFFRIGYLDAVSYPLSFVLGQLGSVIPSITYFFIAKLIDRDGPSVANDFYTFVVCGLIVLRVMQAVLDDYSALLQRSVDQGQLELYLVEPIRWSLLPFALVQWLLVSRMVTGLAIVGGAVALGAHFEVAGIPKALALFVLGLGAVHSLGILAGSLRLLAKRADPILTVYGLAILLLSGALFPLSLLPGPLRAISYLLPHSYVITGLRRVLMPDGHLLPGVSFGQSVLALLAFNVVGYTVALWAFRKALDFGRRTGVLSAY